jgi:acyl carrier protein
MLTRNEIIAEVSAVLVELFEVDAASITLEARLYQDLDLDSIDAIDLVIRLQDLTGKKVKPEEFKTVRTVEDIVNAVEKLVSP